MLSAKLLSCLAVVSAIVMASCEAHAEVAEPDEGSKVLTSPSSAISQHGTTRSLRTADATVAKANEERAGSPKGLGINRISLNIGEKALPSPSHGISIADLQDHTNMIHPNAAELNDIPFIPLDILLSYKHEGEQALIEVVDDYYLQMHILLSWLAKENKLLLEKASFNQGGEALVEDAGKGKAAAVVVEKSTTDEHVEEIRSDLQKLNAYILRNQENHQLTRDEIKLQFHNQQNNMEADEGVEGLVANGDKSKAAAGAHAGTDHAAV